MVEKSVLEDKLRTAFNPTELTVEDVSSGCGAKFDVVIVSAAFEGVPLLKRQRQVHAALEEEMKTIHALTMKTRTPAEAAKLAGSSATQ